MEQVVVHPACLSVSLILLGPWRETKIPSGPLKVKFYKNFTEERFQNLRIKGLEEECFHLFIHLVITIA